MSDGVVVKVGRKIYFCNNNGCNRIMEKTSIIQNTAGKYILKKDKIDNVWDVKDGSIKKVPRIPGEYGTVQFIMNNTAIGYKFRFSKTQLLYATTRRSKKVRWKYVKPKTTEFQFLEDGRHLFVKQPGMGKDESLHFIDIVTRHPQMLFYSKGFRSRPREIAKMGPGKGFMNPHFINEGKQIAYWKPGEVDSDANTRKLTLEVIDVKSRKTKELFTVTTYSKSRGGYYVRDAPITTFFGNHPFVMVFNQHAIGGQPDYYTIVNTKTGEKKELAIRSGSMEINPITTHPLYPRLPGTNYSRYILRGRKTGAKSIEIEVLDVYDLQVKKSYQLDDSYFFISADYIP